MTNAEREKLILDLKILADWLSHRQYNMAHEFAIKAATELARLAAENKRLSDDKEFLMPELERLAAENAELRAENKALRHEVEEWKQAWKER